MLQFFCDNIDQLDLALDQLAVRDRNFDRFGLMLVDNVVELTLHRFVQEKASENEFLGRFDSEPKHDPKLVSTGLSHNFDNKAKAASKLGLFDTTVCESLLNLHMYRNTAYHQGLRHDGILHSLTVFYLRIACSILKAYKPGSWSWSSSNRISHRSIKYIGNATRNDLRQGVDFAFGRLDTVAAALPENLVADLTVDMRQTVDEIDEAIDFLGTDGPDKRNRDETVVSCQAWALAFTDEGKNWARANGWTSGVVGGYVDWLAKSYDWQIKVDPIPSWRSRLDALSKEENYHKALKRYCDFLRQTESFRACIQDSAAQLDMHIQAEIDRIRGK